MYLFVHVPKTAGTSFKNLLVEGPFKKNEIAVIESIGWTETSTSLDITTNRNGLPGSVSVNPSSNIKMICGHFIASHLYKKFPNSTLITWVREPAQRLVSNYYYYLQACTKNSWLPELSNKPNINIKEYEKNYNIINLESYIKHPLNQNLMARQIDIPLKLFKFVGITEHFKTELSRFEITTGLKLTKLHSEDNVNPIKKTAKENYSIDEKTLALIKEYNSEDYKIYDKCLKINNFK